MKKAIAICTLISLVFCIPGYSQIMINGKQWKPKTKEEKEAEKKKKEEENKKAETEKQTKIIGDSPAQKETENKVAAEPKNEAKKVYSEEEVIKIMDKKSYPSYNADKSELESIRKMFGGNDSHDSDEGHDEEQSKKARELKFIHPDVNLIENLVNTKTKFDKYSDLYGTYWKIYQEQMGSQEPLESSYNKAKSTIQQFEFKIDLGNYSSGNPLFLAQKEIDNALEYADNGANWNQLEYHMQNTSRYIAYIKHKKGDNAPGLSDLVKKNEEAKVKIIEAKKQFDAKNAAIELASIEEKRAPAEKYNGADKESLRQRVIAAWNKQNCKEYKLIKVIFTTNDWKRYKGTNYYKSTSTFNDYDYSELQYVILYKQVSENQTFAYIAEYNFIKDHFINKMEDPEFSCDFSLEDKLLLKNIK